jgi:hypothetical protein
MIGHNLATRTDATLNLQAGTVNTIAIVRIRRRTVSG